MLVACRLACLSALGAHYADDTAQAQSGVEEQQDRRRPLRCMRRPVESYSDVILRLAAALARRVSRSR
jgi:hypothetical protein